MYLKRLEIKGFKSFAEKTVLDFLPYNNNRYSITAIVGPNGSGKSNVSDAIRWVMGEQSLKTLRGKKSEDVIFNGSEVKGQLSAAEVTMVLDNSSVVAGQPSAVMPDFSEITVSRRLYRSGEGEYLINNNPVRLLDVHLFLAQAQFAQHSYSVVGQGTIDKLLTVTPAERKDFLDEASGIKEFQIKQHQAQLKLSRTKENLDQAQRLVEEVEPRLKILAKQVKKLEKRQEIEIELKSQQETYYASLFTANKAELDVIAQTLSQVEVDYRAVFGELDHVQNELATLAKASTRQEVFSQLQTQFQILMREKNDIERQLAIKDGQMRSEYGKEGKQNISWLDEKIHTLSSQYDALSAHISAMQLELEQSSVAVVEQKNILEQISAEKTRAQLKVADLEKQIFYDQSEHNYRQVSGLFAVQSILENKDRFGTVYGLVAELGEVEEKYRLALEVAAGSYLSAVVVENEEVARLGIEFLRHNRLGTATFLPLNKIRPRSGDEAIDYILQMPGVIGLASDIIKYEDKFHTIFSFVFGQTVVVEDLMAAQKIGVGRARMVTLTGDVVEKTGAMKGGFKQIKKGSLGFSGHVSWSQDKLVQSQAEVQLEKQKIADLEVRYEKTKEQLFAAESKKQIASSRLQLLEEEIKKAAEEKGSLEHERALYSADPAQIGALLAQLAAEKKVLEAQKIEKETEVAACADKINNFNREEEEKKQRVFSLQDLMQKKQQHLNEILAKRSDLKIEVAKLETKQDAIAEEVRMELGVSVETVSQIHPSVLGREHMAQLLDEIQKLKYQLSLIGGIDTEVVGEYEQTKERFDFLSDQISDLRSAFADLEKMILELDEIMKKKRAASFKKIRKEFDRYIKILFGGGDGDIYEVYGQTNEEDQVDAETDLLAAEEVKPKQEKILTGIDISINPPGKKVKNINTLSGGERTLASIALICAILSYNPSPFVVLDEVEAALDEANTRRFAQIVSELSTRSQFIIISHNRVTMHAADALYGVVMNNDGISKLLSVKLEEVPDYSADTAKTAV